jgi:hypothetical protein
MGYGSVQASHSASVIADAFCYQRRVPWYTLTDGPVQCNGSKEPARFRFDWILATELAQAARHVFGDRPNSLLGQQLSGLAPQYAPPAQLRAW